MLSVELTSSNGHTVKWDSHPVVKRKTQGNLLLSAAICLQVMPLLQSVSWHHALVFNFSIKVSFMTHRKSPCSLLFTRHGRLKVGGKLRFSLPGVLLILIVMVVVTVPAILQSMALTIFQVVMVTEVTSSNATEKEEFTIQLLEGKDITRLVVYNSMMPRY